MRSIFKLFKANLRHKKGTFIGIVILMTIVTFCYSGTVSNNRNLEKAILDDFSHRHIGDIVINMMEPSDELISRIEKDDRVTDHFTEQILALSKPVRAGGEEVKALDTLLCYDSSYQIYNDDITGFAPDGTAPEKGEIFLSYHLYGLKGCALGDTVEIETKNGYDESFRIAGFYQETFRGGFGYGCGLINKADFDRIFAEKTDDVFDSHRRLYSYTSLHINIKDGTDYKTLKNDLKIGTNSETIQLKSEAIESNMIYATTGTMLVAAYTVMLILIVMIVLGHAITSVVETDYVNLGVLKSQGFGKWHLRAVYILQYGLALLIGSVLGILLTLPAISVLGRLFMKLSGILADNSVAVGKCSLYALGIFLLCTLFVILTTAKIGKISPVRAISGNQNEVYFDNRLHMPIRKKGLSFFIALRQFTSRIKSYVSSFLIVSLLVFFLCTVMFFAKGLNRDMFVIPTGDIDLNMLSGKFQITQEAELEAIYRKYDPDAELLLWTGRMMDLDGEETLCQLYSRPKNFDPVLEGRQPKYNNEIILTELLAERLHKQIGDRVTIEYQGNKGEYVITGLFQSILSPAIAEMSFEAGEQIGVNNPDTGYILLKDTSRKDALVKELNDKLGDLLEASAIEPGEYLNGILEQVDLLLLIIISVVFVISVIFAAVVVTMICKRSFRRECIDIGIFRAVGFSVQGLRKQFSLRFLLVGMAGSVLGCVCSYALSLKLLSVLLRFLGITRFNAPQAADVYLLPALAICAAFAVFSYISSRRVKTLSVRALISE